MKLSKFRGSRGGRDDMSDHGITRPPEASPVVISHLPFGRLFSGKIVSLGSSWPSSRAAVCEHGSPTVQDSIRGAGLGCMALAANESPLTTCAARQKNVGVAYINRPPTCIPRAAALIHASYVEPESEAVPREMICIFARLLLLVRIPASRNSETTLPRALAKSGVWGTSAGVAVSPDTASASLFGNFNKENTVKAVRCHDEVSGPREGAIFGPPRW